MNVRGDEDRLYGSFTTHMLASRSDIWRVIRFRSSYVSVPVTITSWPEGPIGQSP
jgi:hypothetical protein